MKNLLLLGAMAAVAFGAQAQYSCDPTTEAILDKSKVATVWYMTLSDTSVETLTKAGAKVNYIGPNADEGRNLWYWAGWEAGPQTNPGVGLEDGEYFSVIVTGTAGWSGGGLAINGPLSKDDKGNPTPGAGVDMTGIDDNTHFHFAYCTNGSAPASAGLILLNEDGGNTPAKFSVGKAAFDDNGTIYPLVGDDITDEWKGIDITLGDLKKVCTGFAYKDSKDWGGNWLAMLTGNTPQTNFCMDAIYMYNLQGSRVEGVEADAAFAMTANTINVLGGKGIKLYNMAGQLVGATEGTTLGITDLAAGVYVAKSGAASYKFVK